MTARGFQLDGSRWSSAVAGGASSPIDLSISYNAETREVTRHPDGAVIGDDIFTTLDALTTEDPTALWVGYLGYACRPDLRARPATGIPDAVWMRSEDATHARRPVPSHGRVVLSHGRAATSHAPAAYEAAFAEVQRRLRAGDSYEINLTRRVALDSKRDPDQVFATLCDINPAPYAAHIWHDGTHVLSASPESFVSILGGRVRTMPIKGTTARSSDPAEDVANRERLANDPRYRAENLMITDLMRNDLSQVCAPGSVEVIDLMHVESYSAVHQLVTTVEGDLTPGITAVEAIRALFPAGSMTGAPKQRTMEIIDAVEDTPRGVYSGALGWIRGNECELSVVIRTLIRDPANRWHAGTGGGITVHSDAASEWDESEWKLNRLVSALG
ncbi:MAG: anthranilate synthase component I family protein [Marmoricola sp.]